MQKQDIVTVDAAFYERAGWFSVGGLNFYPVAQIKVFNFTESTTTNNAYDCWHKTPLNCINFIEMA
jgi:hypothetical protein